MSSANLLPRQASESKKRLALAIIDFLNASSTDGSVSGDDKDSLEVASQCIADAFKVDPTNKSAVADALGGQSLATIYGVFEKMKAKQPNSPAATTPTSATPKSASPSDADKAEADALKSKGNAAMAKKDYPTAIEFYTHALKLNPNNPIYLSNRAAAYSSSGKYDDAITDAQIAVDADPKYTKAWSRLGLARYAKGDSRGSMEAYKAGIDAEGNGGSDIMRRGYETAKRRVEEDEAASDDDDNSPATRGGPGAGGMPDMAGLASMFGGGGGGGGGGMPDLSSIMSNPMFSQMAQNLMRNPELMSGLMNNPRLRDMMDSVGGGAGGGGGGGGGMPDLSSLMQDPNIAEM